MNSQEEPAIVAVKKGMTILDRVDPEWRASITHDIDIRSGFLCILGQWDGRGYFHGLDRLTGDGFNGREQLEFAREHGFVWSEGVSAVALERAWALLLGPVG